VNDAPVQLAVLQELEEDTHVAVTVVGVESNDGIVTLTGTVSNYAKRRAAAGATHRERGVLDVADGIQVHLPSIRAQRDTDIAHAVRQALEWGVIDWYA
jgi:osmotically-inducible protein OsmY